MNVSDLTYCRTVSCGKNGPIRHNVNSVRSCSLAGDCFGGKPYESVSARPLFPNGEEGTCEVLSIWIFT